MITLPKADKARTRRLEAGEEQRLLIGANDQLQRIITLALETGMRRGEILNIKKSHIDLTLKTLFIPFTKTNEPRTVPLSSTAIASLTEQMRTSQRHSREVFELTETPLFIYTGRGLSGAFLKLCRKVKIEDLHFHDLRHEATSRLFEKDLNPVEVATITGHKDTKMLMRYTQRIWWGDWAERACRVGYTSCIPRLITAVVVSLFAPSHDIQFSRHALRRKSFHD
jgi:integrase